MRTPIRLTPAWSPRRHASLAAALLVVVLVAALAANPAGAATPAPGWAIESVAAPTNFSAADNAGCLKEIAVQAPPCDAYQVYATNAGSEPTGSAETREGRPVTPIVLTDTLPKGVTVRRISLRDSAFPGGELASLAGCAGATVVKCELPGEFAAVAPDGTLEMTVYVTVDEPQSSGAVSNRAAISGAGAAEMSTSRGTEISSVPPPFGPASFNFAIDGLSGEPDSQASDHPYELTTTIDLNTVFKTDRFEADTFPTSVQDLKEVVVDLPLGFAGSTLAAPECTLSQLSSVQHCPHETVVGHIETQPADNESVNSPIWNLVPERGVPGEFGYVDGDKNTHVFYVHVVPTPEGYVLQATNPEIPQVILSHIVVTFYGNPAERDGTGAAHVPFFTNPSACDGGPLKATIYMDSWQRPGAHNPDGTPALGDPAWVHMTSEAPPVTGCDQLQFAPELLAQPTTSQADTPSGLEFELKLPQTEDVGVNATPALKNATVTFPEGMTVDPSSGNGLQACSVAQIGWLGGSPFNFSPAAPQCPEASKIGSLELETPLIPGTLRGEIYLAAQNENPFGSTLATYVVVDDPVTGVVLKIAGELKADEHTGRLTAFFPENAQLPFSDLRLHFFGGPRAELATPESCGTFTTTSDLEPWSAPDSGPDGMPFDSFQIGEGCVGGFAPAFTAGSTNLQAGAYTNFVASFSRQDSDQEMGGLTLTLPPGLLANVGSVPQCTEAQVAAARAGTGGCPEATRVGTVTALAGPGPNPLFVGGKAYLTGPYNGGPYGLAVVVPAIAGPFTFGNVVVRQSLRIDPHTAQVTDVSDPFPTFLDQRGANGQVSGVPIKLKRIDVSIDRPNFTFNPTSCNKLQLAGSMTSITGASAALSTPFQVTNCATLKFAPKFSVSTSGKTSKANGASLIAKLSYPNAPQGTQANIARVKVDLPKQLPSRLTTLQKACTAAQFNTNPAGCPAASLIGHATVHTPILPLPLLGPAIFVSHGGEAFPSLTMVLQGNGVTVDLVGSTFISKAGITSSTFRTVPDVPVGTFELTLPQGKYSALAANGNLCNSKLAMPTAFVAQNGLVIHQSTKVAVTGCAKHKVKRAKRHGRHRGPRKPKRR